MEIKHLVSKYVYRIEPKPDGGFIAHATDPNIPPLEAPTREELQQKIQSTILSGLGSDFPGLKLPLRSSEMKFSFHVEKQPDGTFDIHSSDPSSAPINAASHDQVESHFAERLIAFIGKHMLQGAPENLRDQLASGDIKVFINKSSGFTVTTSPQGTPTSNPMLTSADASTSGSILSNASPNFGDSGNPVDSSPITPSGPNAKTFLLVLAILALCAFAYFFFHYR